MGRQKKGNANAQRNHNAKKMAKRSHDAEFASYSENEVLKSKNNHNPS